ncbi:MAG TPA: hypothetical protein VGW38_16295 [Chloroflexota bacterium]|nr:hypothetical protein [Chloroflexota bacterium]
MPESDDGWLAPPVFPPRRASAGAYTGPVDNYLQSLAESLAGQLDPALEATGILTPLGCVARAALVEQIGADLEAAVRDLMLSGIPRDRAEEQAVEALGPAPLLGKDLLTVRRRKAVEAWERSRDSAWWLLEPLLPISVICGAVFLAALAPVIALIAGMVAEPQLGTLGVAFVPLVCSVLVGVAETLAADIDLRQASR